MYSWNSMISGYTRQGQLPDQEHVAKMLIEPQNGVNYVLLSKIRDAGYVPESKYALYDLELENKQELLSYHSEKLAIAFVLTRKSELAIRNSGKSRTFGFVGIVTLLEEI
ncbi:hypothetical protein HN51_049137 [Arachis hypogaea]